MSSSSSSSSTPSSEGGASLPPPPASTTTTTTINADNNSPKSRGRGRPRVKVRGGGRGGAGVGEGHAAPDIRREPRHHHHHQQQQQQPHGDGISFATSTSTSTIMGESQPTDPSLSSSSTSSSSSSVPVIRQKPPRSRKPKQNQIPGGPDGVATPFPAEQAGGSPSSSHHPIFSVVVPPFPASSSSSSSSFTSSSDIIPSTTPAAKFAPPRQQRQPKQPRQPQQQSTATTTTTTTTPTLIVQQQQYDGHAPVPGVAAFSSFPPHDGGGGGGRGRGGRVGGRGSRGRGRGRGSGSAVDGVVAAGVISGHLPLQPAVAAGVAEGGAAPGGGRGRGRGRGNSNVDYRSVPPPSHYHTPTPFLNTSQAPSVPIPAPASAPTFKVPHHPRGPAPYHAPLLPNPVPAGGAQQMPGAGAIGYFGLPVHPIPGQVVGHNSMAHHQQQPSLLHQGGGGRGFGGRVPVGPSPRGPNQQHQQGFMNRGQVVTSHQPGVGGGGVAGSYQQPRAPQHQQQQQRSSGSRRDDRSRPRFSEYVSPSIIEEGLTSGRFVRGTVRINARKRSEAYITIEGIEGGDVYIPDLACRNRAYERDVVIVELLDKSKWKVIDKEDDDDKDSGASSSEDESSSSSEGEENEEKKRHASSSSSSSTSSSTSLTSSKVVVEPLLVVHTDLRQSGGDGKIVLGTFPLETSDKALEEAKLIEALQQQKQNQATSSTAPPVEAAASQKSKDNYDTANVDNDDDVDSLTFAIGSTSLKDNNAATNNVASASAGDAAPHSSSALLATTSSSASTSTPSSSSSFSSSPSSNSSSATPAPTGSPFAPTTSSSSSSSSSNNNNNNGANKVNHELLFTIECPSSLRDAILSSMGQGLQPAGRVVYILEAKHTTDHIGLLKGNRPEGSFKQGDKQVIFQPFENKLPRAMIPASEIPRLQDDPLFYKDKLVLARFKTWSPNMPMPFAKFVKVVGVAGDIGAETEALLMESGVNSSPFTPQVIQCLPVISPQNPWKVTDSELAKRRDLRSSRIFSIDPPTARDLDDALSYRDMGDGTIEIGVHIADVSHFVLPGTALDAEARDRATTVYLVQKAIPMLPGVLCEDLCSLNPGVDRYAFSAIWRLSSETGDIVEEWFGKSVINSCTKLSYDLAQTMIDGKIVDNWNGADRVSSTLGPYGKHTVAEIAQDVVGLHKLAMTMRRIRFERGALSLDGIKLTFQLDTDGTPIGTCQYAIKDSNRLVEEYMLLANMQVAKKIASGFPHHALLRKHPSPHQRRMRQFMEFCTDVGYGEIDGSSSKSLNASIKEARARGTLITKESTTTTTPATIPSSTSSSSSAKQSTKKTTKRQRPASDLPVLEADAASFEYVDQAIRLMSTRSMQLAKYFCTGKDSDEALWHHYALNVGHYTHFTSPIRRYADVIVHRLLQAAIEKDASSSSSSSSSSTLNAADDEAVERHILGAKKPAAGQQGPASSLLSYPNVGKVAEHCNEKKISAGNAQEASDKIYLCTLLRSRPALTDAIVLGTGPRGFIVCILPAFGMEVRVYIEDQPLAAGFDYYEDEDLLLIKWKPYVKELEHASLPRQPKNNNNNNNNNQKGRNNNNNNNNKKGASAPAGADGNDNKDVCILQEVREMSVLKVLLTVKKDVIPADIDVKLHHPFSDMSRTLF